MSGSGGDMAEIRHPIGANGSLSLRNISGVVHIVGIESPEAVVRVTGGGGAPRLNVERTPGGLLVEPERTIGGLGFGINIGRGGDLDFEVEVPRGANLDVKTVSGDIDAGQVTGDQRYKTVSGDIRLRAAAGRISAMSVSGDVRIHESGEVELNAATTSGDVLVEATSIWLVGVRTVSGDVHVAGRLQSGPRHAVETVSGDLILEPQGGVTIESRRALDFARKGRAPVVVGDGSAQLSFRSMSGEEHVRQPKARSGDPSPVAPETRAEHDRLAILRALERGEIDVDEASRRLEGVARG